MNRIKLTQGKYAIVDDEDFKWLNQWRWYYDGRYARMNYKNKKIHMHRLIMNTPKGMDTDHINGNGLDNRRCNLRICTSSQNHINTKKRKNNTSGYKGVFSCQLSKNWRAQIRYNHKSIHIGNFINKIQAAKAYNQKAKELFGEFARLN